MKNLIEIVCSMCDETVETTQRTGVFPFVCQECQDAKEFQDKISPVKTEPFAGFPQTETSVPFTQVARVGTRATGANEQDVVENASAIITDLERQAQTSNELIADLSQQNLKLVADYDALAAQARKVSERADSVIAQAEKVTAENAALKESEETTKFLLDRAEKSCTRLIAYNETLADKNARIHELERAVKDALGIANFWKRRNDYWKERYFKVSSDNTNLLSRGFWARVFNHDC